MSSETLAVTKTPNGSELQFGEEIPEFLADKIADLHSPDGIAQLNAHNTFNPEGLKNPDGGVDVKVATGPDSYRTVQLDENEAEGLSEDFHYGDQEIVMANVDGSLHLVFDYGGGHIAIEAEEVKLPADANIVLPPGMTAENIPEGMGWLHEHVNPHDDTTITMDDIAELKQQIEDAGMQVPEALKETKPGLGEGTEFGEGSMTPSDAPELNF